VGASGSAEATCTGKVIQVVVEEDRATRVPLKQAMTHREQVRGAGSSGDT